MSGVTAQRPGKMKGRRSDRAGGARASKTPAGDNLAHLLAPNVRGERERGRDKIGRLLLWCNSPFLSTLLSLVELVCSTILLWRTH
ncbi:hypothetical protein GBAR_LOCUS9935 [Geodia barretti]|uniref:Uncharacterized protein n=1 Tax=Geodia barretti TaxID=519541 RepID=A0AA35WD39_GEOBA|nr:hypothetical protein GBAR_LOCUS9935 [Geodia barretti]